jgi:hypothetical protein
MDGGGEWMDWWWMDGRVDDCRSVDGLIDSWVDEWLNGYKGDWIVGLVGGYSGSVDIEELFSID